MPPLIPKRTDDRTTEQPLDLVGQEFEGRYRIEAHVGQGGFGVVYRATDTKLSRQVAVKVLCEAAGMRQSQRRRFEREAEALAVVSHPNVVGVLDFGVADDTPYLVMELLEGESLADLLTREAPLTPKRALHTMSQLLAGLRYVHERGVVHRDLKPGNVFMQSLPGGGEQVKLLDFGLAKFLGTADGENDQIVSAQTLTRSGEIFGTPGYMPAEQMLGKPVDASADVYSAAVILYEMLTGDRPYRGTMVEVVKQQLEGVVPRLEDADVGRTAHTALDALFARALSPTPETRHSDAIELSAAFDALPADCVEVQSAEVREQMQRARHEASTRAGEKPSAPSAASTVVFAPSEQAVAARSTPADARRPSGKVAVPAFLANASAWFVAVFKGTIRAGAFVIATASVLMIAMAAIVIYVFSQPDLDRERDLLRGAIPARLGAKVNDLLTKRAKDEADARDAENGSPADSVPTDVSGPMAATPPSAARDPWQSRGRLPAVLSRARATMLKGKVSDERTFSALRGYNREHPDDARGHLLLGGLYMNRKWFSDGVQQYKLAFQIDTSSRGDTHAVRDLLNLAGEARDVWAEAESLLIRTYGSELHADIRRALRTTSQPDVRTRLVQLETHIAK